jgi:hypothetical protein
MMQEWKLINYLKMSNIGLTDIPSSTSQSEEYLAMRKKHMRESSEYSDDGFNIKQIFGFVLKIYKNISSEQKNTLKTKKEEDITDSIRRDIQKDEDFRCSGFTVNTEARNQSYEVGYYDLKFENPAYWIGKYFVFGFYWELCGKALSLRHENRERDIRKFTVTPQ